MPFFVLLLTPRVKKFELIHFKKTPECVTVQSLLDQVTQLTQNVEFQEQVHLGFYCPKTKQKLLSLENLDDKEDVSIATESTGKETIGTTLEPYPLKSIQEEEERSKDTINDVVATSEEASSRSKSAKELKDLNPIPTEISTFASSPSNDPNANSMDPILDLESLGPILVAIPKDYKMRQIIKQVDKILESPAFRLLTANSLEQAGNMTVAQELEQLKQQSLTTNVAIYLNEQVTQNQQATAFYEEQQLDLEKRRISPKATIPDAHGLSPLDAMRVAQNQQKAAARQQEKTTLQQYQKHLDTLVVDTSMATTSTTTTGELSTPEVQALITPSLGTTNQDIPSPNSEEIVNRNNQSSPSINELPGMFVSSSLARRQSLEQQKQAELDAIRKQGLAQTKMNAAYFASQETTAKARRESYQEQTKAELASLSNLNLQKSWRDITSLSSLPQPVSPKIQSNHSVKMIVTTAPTSANNGNATTQPELEDLRRQGLTKVMSLQQIPVLEKKPSSLSSSMSELEQLKTLGLTKTLKSQFVDTVKVNQEQTLAYQAQVKDLKERKAKTKTFEASRNELSAADAAQLNFAKQKREDELKKREAMGYYQSYKGEVVIVGDKDWKTKGKVLTTIGQGSTITTKEWEAAEGQTPKDVAQAPNKHEQKTKSTEEVKQGCACIIL